MGGREDQAGSRGKQDMVLASVSMCLGNSRGSHLKLTHTHTHSGLVLALPLICPW